MIQDNYRISNQEIALFNSFGFLIRRNVFTPEEMAKVNEEFDHRRASVVAEIDPKEDRIFTQWPTRNPETPFTASLLEDPRIYVPMEQLAGEDSVSQFQDPIPSHPSPSFPIPSLPFLSNLFLFHPSPFHSHPSFPI